MTSTSSPSRGSIRRHLLAAGLAAFMLVGGVGGWAATTELSGAVIAPGVLVVETNIKKVQHPTGGIVGELRVQDGDHVRAGDVVIRLDPVQTQATLSIATKTLDELGARQARLEAERDDAASVTFPAELLARQAEPEVASAVKGEQRVFELRTAARAGQKSQLGERIAQLRQEIDGIGGQIQSKASEIGLIKSELDGVRTLWKRNLVPIDRVTAIEREAVRLEGERGSLVAMQAQTRGKITETELQIIQIDQDLRSEVARELGEVRSKVTELAERKIAGEDQLRRIDIRSPQNGIVHQLAVHTVGGVVPAGDALMLIVPDNDALDVEAKIAPQDIDQLHIGQRAVMRFSAFDQRTTPEIDGTLSRISADITSDQRTGGSFYTVRIAVAPAELARLGPLKLVPGMPVEVFLQTSPRTVLSFLTKPLHDQVSKAFRE